MAAQNCFKSQSTLNSCYASVDYCWQKLLELCFLELSLCTFGANAAALIVSAGK